MNSIIQKVTAAFRRQFAGQPLLVRSPGRVNLIGEHTDYNEGFVLPAAIDRAVIFATVARADNNCRFFAVDRDEHFEGRYDSFKPVVQHWPNYLLGVMNLLHQAGHPIRGVDCAFGGDIPIGAGLSSSAALEAGLAFTLNHLFELKIEPLALARLAQRAEHEFAGVRCGIMDQYINLFGRAGSVLKLDCRSLQHHYYPFAREDIRIVLCDTGVHHKLASSEYNTRRQQCETGVAIVRRRHPEVRSLRDVTQIMLNEAEPDLEPVVLRRCAYIIRENDRVEAACADLERIDLASFGRRMALSHQGLRDDYEVSCRELDSLVEAAQTAPGLIGSRMMGGGFGGCTISLVEADHLVDFTLIVQRQYQREFGREPKIHTCQIQGGTSII